MTHLAALETAALANGNSRSVAKGYNASADYIETTLRNTGHFDVVKQPFVVPVWTQLEDPLLEIINVETIEPTRCHFRTGW